MMEPLVYIAVGVAQILAFLGGGGAVAYRIGRSTMRVEASIDLQRAIAMQNGQAITELKTEVTGLKSLLTEVALQKQELRNLASDIAELRRWYDELRHGEGMVFPLKFPKEQGR